MDVWIVWIWLDDLILINKCDNAMLLKIANTMWYMHDLIYYVCLYNISVYYAYYYKLELQLTLYLCVCVMVWVQILHLRSDPVALEFSSWGLA